MTEPKAPDPEPKACLAVDYHNLDYRSSFILCHRPEGHEGDHGNRDFTWPRKDES